jgi:hypothetical protein
MGSDEARRAFWVIMVSHRQLQRSTVSRRDFLSLAGILGVALVGGGCARSLSRPLLSESDVALIGEIADIIIPSTDTAGAKQAGVAEFARMMVSEWVVEEEQGRFLAGLRTFDNEAARRHGNTFLHLSAPAQQEMVRSLLAAAESGTAGSNDKPPFLVLVKRLTVLGYYTSEVGAAEELDLNLVPGKYDPCAQVERDVRAGSTGFRNPTFSAS